MKRLLIMRHAKSAWDRAGVDDHDRILSPRGRRAARLMGGWIADEGLIPDAAIVSTSARTRETWALVAHQFERAPAPTLSAQLYHASATTMLEIARNAPERAETVLLLGHQPGMADLLALLTEDHEAWLEVPTGAIAVLETETPTWRDLAPGAVTPAIFARPKDLV